MDIRVGFVGAGGRAKSHIRALEEIEDVQITGICDVVEERAEQVAEEVGGQAYTDYREMFDRENLTVLYVVVPTFAHYDVEILAAKQGIHLFLEKPVAPTMDKALEILNAIQKAKVLSCVGYQLRYLGYIKQVRRFLEGRKIGMAVANRWSGLPETPWWRMMAQSGGQLVEQTTHQVDLLRYLVGEVEEVQAYYALRTLKDVPDLDIPDVYTLSLKFASGAIGSLSSCCTLRKGGGDQRINLISEDFRIVVEGNLGVEVIPEGAVDLGPVPVSEKIDMVFIDAVRRNDGSKILSDFEDGARSLDVTLAANRSAETGHPEKPHFPL